METSRGAAAVPIIRRARGFRLYDQHGRRYLDLYRDGEERCWGIEAA